MYRDHRPAARHTAGMGEAARRIPDSSSVLSDPRITHVNGDGRAFIMRSPRRFDIIEADALRPTSAYAGTCIHLATSSCCARGWRRGASR